MGDGALFSLGLLTGDLPEGEEDRPGEQRPSGVLIVTAAGEVDLRIGDGARPNFGLVAGDNAKASIWLLVGIFIGGNFFPLKPSLRPGLIERELIRIDFLGLARGELGDEWGDPGTRVSELVHELIPCGLFRDPTNVSDEAPVPT